MNSQMVDARPNALGPGAPVTSLGGAGAQLYGVDPRGTLVRYRRTIDGHWSSSQRVARGFAPGGFVAATRYSPRSGPAGIALASVGMKGQALLGLTEDGAWDWQTVEPALLPPGSPLGIDASGGEVSLVGIEPSGSLTQWARDGHRWLSQEIASGFVAGGPVRIHSADRHCFSVDQRGRLIAASRRSGYWRPAICCPEFALAPRLVSRSVRPHPPLPPANIEFVNRHEEELVVRIMDRRRPGITRELRLLPQESWSYRIDRDSGGVWEEVYLTPGGPTGWVEQVQQVPIPPRVLYDVLLYANRTTSVYFDRTTNQSDIPDSVQMSLVSIGMFPIPPGDMIQAGERIDAYQEAKARGNPGAAGWFGNPN
jgi:hypothetical protein